MVQNPLHFGFGDYLSTWSWELGLFLLLFSRREREMHNRKKSTQPPSEAEVAALKKKAFTYQSLINIIFERRQQNDKSPETFELIGKLLKMNPDFYTLWNYRKEILIHNIPQ